MCLYNVVNKISVSIRLLVNAKMNIHIVIYLCLALTTDVLSKHVKIIGGKKANIKKFPYMASLRYDTNNKFFCGCTIISNQHIVTAGHCVDGLLESSIRIYAGSSNLNEHGIEYSVRKIDFPENYVWEIMEDNGSKVKHDIAVITIYPSIEFNEYQNKIELATEDIVEGSIGTISGWGWVKYPNGENHNKLHSQKVMILSNYECQPIFPLQIYDHQVCTLGKKGVGSCFGDSGGPLVINGKLYGVSSLIEPCARGTPDVFTRITHHLDFIMKIIEP